MKGDIALAGYLLTAEEWQSMDPRSRALLITAAARREDPWASSGPITVPGVEPDHDDQQR